MVIVEYCEAQNKAFHVDEIERSIATNLNFFMKDELGSPDTNWVILGIFETREEANDFSYSLKIKKGLVKQESENNEGVKS